MKKILNPNKNEWSALKQRPTRNFKEIEATVTQIFKEIQQNTLPFLTESNCQKSAFQMLNSKKELH